MGDQQSADNTSFEDGRRLVTALFAFWVLHIVLRALLLFRLDPYGTPFLNGPCGSMLYAVCADFSWLFLLTVPFFVLAWALSRRFRIRRWISSVYFVVQCAFLIVTLLDHEMLRFMGCHLTPAFLCTYKDFFSCSEIAKWVAELLFLISAAYGAYRLLLRLFPRLRLGSVALLCTGLFLGAQISLNAMNVGADRARKLAPVVKVLYAEWKLYREGDSITPGLVRAADISARRFWSAVEGADSSKWTYPDYDYPMYRVPKAGLTPDSSLLKARARHSNFIVIYMESQRGLDVGYLNPDDPWESATPVLDSLARSGQAWMQMYASGLPVPGAVLSSHLGFPPHRTRDFAAELVAIRAPSYASVLRDSGYSAEFFSASDPAENNLAAWYRKWYSRVHYDRALGDDSLFFRMTAKYIRDSLAREGRPFVAGLLVNGSRGLANATPGMPDSVKALPPRYRLRWTMHRADTQLGAFIDAIRSEPWAANTYVIVLGVHGFPLGEHGVSTLGAGGYSNSTWIPFVINGPALGTPAEHPEIASQIDIAPTILALAGLRVANAFAGHDMLRLGARSFALGVHSGIEAISFGGFRLLTGLPRAPRDGGDAIFAEEDVYESQSLLGVAPDLVNDYHALADTLLFVNDYTLSRNHVVKAP